jgi:predicted CoA-binding protein
MRTIAQILEDSKNIAVVGLSNKPERASHGVARYLQAQGYRIIPVNPTYAGQQILGELVYPNLHDAADTLARAGQQIDIVDCFRKANDIPPVANEAIAIRASCLWMQLGIENRAAADLAAAAGVDVVMDRCIKVEHAKLRV